MLSLIIAGALGALAGGIAALRVIAPKTKTTKDDDLLRLMIKIESWIDAATGNNPAQTPKSE